MCEFTQSLLNKIICLSGFVNYLTRIDSEFTTHLISTGKETREKMFEIEPFDCVNIRQTVVHNYQVNLTLYKNYVNYNLYCMKHV